MINKLSLISVGALLLVSAGAQAAGDWKFGVGTGFSSFSLDGDIGFATPNSPGPGVVFDIDLDNSDTSDLVDSGLGLGGFASNGPWTILYSVGTATLEGDEGPLEVEWDRTQAELAGVYTFAKTGNHSWGVLFGIRYIEHEWEFSGLVSEEVDESWTDAIVGITHSVPFGDGFSWANRLDAGIGESESSTFISSTLNWAATEHFLLNLKVSFKQLEFGDEDDIADSDFYLYDIDEPAVGIGFLYII